MTLLTRRRPAPRKNTAPVVESVSIPSPVRGLNYKDSLATMRPGDALRLDNMICRPGYVEVRKGWTPHATSIPAPTRSILTYTALDGTAKRFAAAGANIYDASAVGAVGAAVVTGLISDYFNQTMVSNAAGNFLIAVNGQDNGKIYNGTVWADLGVTGVPLNTLSQVAVWKRRVWFVQKNTTKAWYLATDAIAGAATAFDFASIFRRGGRLLALINWTIDGGSGSDDYLLAVTTEGEVAVYKGTDPSSATTFALVGVYYIGTPIGERFHAQLGGDVLMLTQNGLIPFSRYLQSQTVNRAQFLTERIQSLIGLEIENFGAIRGWEVHVLFAQNVVLLQVPGGAEGARYQYAMAIETGGWSRLLFTDAICWASQKDVLYAGHLTQVANSWTTGLDNGQGIMYTVIPAYSYLGPSTQQKLVTLGRLTIQSDQVPTYQTKLLTDFNQEFSFPSLSVPAPSGALWDVAIWDVAVWGGALTMYRNWYSLNGMGYAISQVIQGVSVGDTFRLIAEDYVYQPGGLL